jgi:hypothetical protein
VTDAVAQPDAEKDALSVPESDAVTLSVAVGEGDGERDLFAENVADPGVGGSDAWPETDGVVEGDAAGVRVRGPDRVSVADTVAHVDADAETESALDAEPLPDEEGETEAELVALSESVRVERGVADCEPGHHRARVAQRHAQRGRLAGGHSIGPGQRDVLVECE